MQRNTYLSFFTCLAYLEFIIFLTSCSHFFKPTSSKETVILPFMKNSSNECYNLDQFMPTPDQLVTGKNANLFLRYYTYQNALFKDYPVGPMMLGFFSRDEECWSLFEERQLEDVPPPPTP